jgi:cathepsin B
MNTVFVLSLLAAAQAVPYTSTDSKEPALTQEFIEKINAAKTTWKASMPKKFMNATRADVMRLLGTIMPGEAGYAAPENERTTFKEGDVPDSFDVRTQWPQCESITGRVRDQSDCGSCWAFGSTEAFNDRYCIQTGDATTVFSAEDTLACCSGLKCQMSMGCNGGQPAGAWNWFKTYGVTSGGDYADVGQGTTCKPYEFPSCAHHVEPTDGMVSCEDLNGGEDFKTPKCTSECSESGYKTPYSEDKKFAKSSYSVKSEENMKKELMEKGTLSVAMSVYEDFEAYSSGVYQHVEGRYLGGHAIKMIGWGVDEETNTPYWTCTNSWNDTWGEKGTFRILRGSNECGIEGSVVAGDAA